MELEDEFAQLQQLSNRYVPDVEGDLVGQLQSTGAITVEYAKADPIYISKTQAIPLSYSHYRPILGDGNCGWRAIAFGYFEALSRCSDSLRIQAETVRLRSFENLLGSVGYEKDMYEDWTAETFGLLVRISDETSGPDNGTACLLQAFNNQEIMSSIIMHFRILTSAWLRTNPDAYLPFCQDATIEQYCASKIDPFQVELDHLGLQALIDVVIKPAQFGLEVSCLDLSVGTEMNTLKWNTGDLSSPRWIIRLLYRPGHYDILYKAEDIPQGLLNNPQVHRMSYAALPTFASTALAQYTYSGLVSDDAWQPSNAPVDDWAHDHLSYLLQNDPYSPIHPASTPTSAHFGHTADQTSLSSQPDSLAFSVAPGHLHPHQVPSYSPWTPHSNCSDMTTSSVLSSAPLTSVPAGSHSPQPNSLAFSVAPGHLHPHQVPSDSSSTSHINCSDMTISSFSNSAPLISVPAGSLSQKPVDPFRKTEWNRRLSARTTKRTYRKSGKGRCAPASVSRFSGGKHHFKNRNFQPEHYEPE